MASLDRLEFFRTVCPSMVGPDYQFTLRTGLAKKLRSSSRAKSVDVLLQIRTLVLYRLTFRRQKHRYGGWRADKETWRLICRQIDLQAGEELVSTQMGFTHIGTTPMYMMSSDRIENTPLLAAPRRFNPFPPMATPPGFGFN